MSAEPTGTRAEPLDPAHAARTLELATDREQVFELVLRAVRSRTRFAALLSVHADALRGRRALADRFFDVSQVTTVQLERHVVHALEDVIEQRTARVGSIATGEPFLDGMLDALGGATPAALVLPIANREHTVALIVAHRGEDAMAATDVADLLPLVDAAHAALTRMQTKRASTLLAEPPARGTTQGDGYEVLEVALDEAPAPAVLRTSLAAARRDQDFRTIATTLRALVRRGMATGDPDEDEQLDLLIELGTVEAQHLMRPDRAIEAWKNAQSIDASNPQLLDAIEGLL
ncbi:MAG TPA: hypothetical protein VK427_23825, partial [Kofleriaceae bacterium]|nr:hypothetical protein [Kofleriaceae bacterium]